MPGFECRILVVDDNRDHTDSTAIMLESIGHHVERAYDGGTAIEVAKVFAPDIVLLNLAMPKITGVMVARAIREAEGGHLVHLAALTGFGREADKVLTRAAGFDAHLVKPVSPDALEQMLQHWCEKAHAKRSVA